MSVLIKDMDMPKVCITKDEWYGNCPMDRLWCAQRFAPKDMTMGEIRKAQLENIPEWCPLVTVPVSHEALPEIRVTNLCPTGPQIKVIEVKKRK